MKTTPLILMEGITGSGKSTTTQRLSLHLTHLGFPNRWHYEHDTDHPIWPVQEGGPLGIAGPEFTTQASEILQRWQKLAADKGNQTLLLESSYLTAMGYLLAGNLPHETILSFCLDIQAALSDCQTALVYLRQPDVESALRSVCKDRENDDYAGSLVQLAASTPYGQRNGVADFQGVIGFFEVWQRLVDELFDLVDLPKILINNPGRDWRDQELKLTQFFDLPEIPCDWPQPEGMDTLDCFTGVYEDAEGEDGLIIAADSAGLFIGDARHTRLYAVASRRFQVQSMNVEIEFETGKPAPALKFSAGLPGLSPVWRRKASEA